MSLDILARLLILEGVGNVDPFSWSRCATPRALSKAQGLLEGSPDPLWFKANTGTYNILLNRLSGDLRRSGIRHITGEDLMQQALAGLTAQGQPCKNKFHAVGVLARGNVIKGTETPTRLAQGTLGTWLHRMALNQLKRKDATLSLDTMEHTPHVTYEAPDPLRIAAHCLFGGGEIATSFQKLMQATAHARFAEGTQKRILMDTWVAALTQGRLLVPGIQWATEAGILSGNTPRAKNNAIKASWAAWKGFSPKLTTALQQAPDLNGLLDLRMTYESDLRAQVPRSATLC